jgi:hypothetical protein
MPRHICLRLTRCQSRLPSSDARRSTHKSAIASYRTKSDVIIVDTDSASLADNNILQGLGGKFEREGFSGNLWFVKGGYEAIAKVESIALVADDGETTMALDSGSEPSTSSSAKPGLITGGLGKLAFLQGESRYFTRILSSQVTQARQEVVCNQVRIQSFS